MLGITLSHSSFNRVLEVCNTINNMPRLHLKEMGCSSDYLGQSDNIDMLFQAIICQTNLDELNMEGIEMNDVAFF